MKPVVLSWPLTHEPWGYTIERAVMEIRTLRENFNTHHNGTFVIEGDRLFYMPLDEPHDRESDNPPGWVRNGLIWRPVRAA